MADEMKLAKQEFGPDWIDLSYGEPTVVTNVMSDVLDFYKHKVQFPTVGDVNTFQYQPARGYLPLVKLLEAKYKSKVVVTNGARQGISAVAYALKKVGKLHITVPAPMWPSTISLVKDSGLQASSGVQILHQPVMITTPNNPDGKEVDTDLKGQLRIKMAGYSHIIHDAAYYTPVYSNCTNLNYKFGDAQIFSFSKMYGLSGLRMGFVLCHSDDLYPHMVEYMERSTSGVSIMSQMAIHSIEKLFLEFPEALAVFEEEARLAIQKNRELLARLHQDVLIPAPSDSNSMFAWCHMGSKFDPNAAKVFLANGVLFGAPAMVRINMAADHSKLVDAITRLNSSTNEAIQHV